MKENQSPEQQGDTRKYLLQQPAIANNISINDALRQIKTDRLKFDSKALKQVKVLHYNDCNSEQADQLWQFAGEIQYCINIPVEERFAFIIDHFPITLIDDIADNIIRISSIEELHIIMAQILNLSPGSHRANVYYLILQRMVKIGVSESDYESLFNQVEPDEEIFLRKNLAITKSLSN